MKAAAFLVVFLGCAATVFAECGGNLNATNGTITSPNYPSPYGSNLKCQWVVTVAAGSTININITDLDIDDPDESCTKESLEIIQGLTPSAYCGQRKPTAPIEIKGNKVTIKFTSEGGNHTTRKGFKLTYTAVTPSTASPITTTTITQTTSKNVTDQPTNSTTAKLPTVKPKKSKKLPSWCIALIVILVLLVVLLIIDLILYRKRMGVIYNIKSACCGESYQSVD